MFLVTAVVATVAVVAFLMSRGGEREQPVDELPPDGGKGGLTAIQKGSSGKGAQDGAKPGGGVEVNARTLLGGKVTLELEPEEVDRVLDVVGRSQENLVAAQALLDDYSYLEEAAAEHPDDPEVQFWVLSQRVLPGERAAWIERFKESEPDNALASYFAAEHAFRQDDIEAGIEELRSATEKGYRDYSDSLQEQVENLYTASGKFDRESVRHASAKFVAMPHVEQIQSLSQRIIQQHQKLVEEGEADSAAELVSLGMSMLETVVGNSGADVIDTRTTLLMMQENLQRAAGDSSGKLQALAEERARLGYLNHQVREIFGREDQLDPAQLDSYAERLHEMGEVGAAEWLVEQVGEVDLSDRSE